MDLRTTPIPPPVTPHPPASAPAPWAPPSPSRDYAFAAGAIIAIIAIVVGCIAMVYDREALGPREWDARVVPLVAFVEEARGYDFVHPVHVEFLTPDQYREKATNSRADSRYIDTMLRVLRSLGLVDGDVDLSAELDEISDSGTLAYYMPDTRRIYVRGTEMTPSLRVTLVHELTHALQDQIFDLDLSARAGSEGEAFALRSLAEGDAFRIHGEYYATLSDAEQKEVDAQSADDVDSSTALNEGSAVMVSLFRAPYDLGIPFVRLLADVDDELDTAFESPPTSEENVLDPSSFFAGDHPQHVAPPTAPTGARLNGALGVEVGAVMWYLLVAAHTDQRQAMVAVDGWGGDAMTVYEQSGQLCTSMVFRGDTAKDANEMHAALTKVVASLSASRPDLTRDASDVTLTVCDPGSSARGVGFEAATVFAAPTVRSLLLGVALDDRAVSFERADCAVDKTVQAIDDATFAHIVTANTRDARIDKVLADLDTALTGCR